MVREVIVLREGSPYRLQLRACTERDVEHLLGVWAPCLEMGPAGWLDRAWEWGSLDAADQLAFDVAPEWLVLTD